MHTHTNYAHPGNKASGGFAKTVTLLFDNDFALTPGTIPKCTDRAAQREEHLAGVEHLRAGRRCGA